MQNDNFYFYLKRKGYVHEVANYYSSNARYYSTWLQNNNHLLATAQYTDLMHYIGHLQAQGKSPVMINKHLRSIEHYYNYKKHPNIAHNLRLKGGKQDAKRYLEAEDLEALYMHYKSATQYHYSSTDSLLLSLIIYQSLSLQELALLTPKAVNLDKGTLYIAGGKYLKNSRTLKLEAHQILPLHTHITTNKLQGNYLFLEHPKLKHRMAKQLGRIHKVLIEQNKSTAIGYQSLKQLRQSRLVYWIKHYGLRQTQYLSGHKGIDSIERYQSEDIEDLAQQIAKLHPLG